ncbi:DUF2625 family protein [Streptomyces sp. NPDC058646]|uniref:DUF2625 family protein n=1 Tax=Streptomyces sp. NPDC058646 TaxID=3346574 RepID=UPI0036596B71
MRELRELTDVEDPAWPGLGEELAAAAARCELLPADPDRGRASLLQLQVTARSYLGAFVLHCGGLLVDDGWLRVYGSPAAANARDLPSLARVNGFPDVVDPAWRAEAGLVLAHDVLGGVFLLNGPAPAGAGRPGAPGEVVYFAPDSLSWEPLGAGHGAWLSWTVSGALDGFYEGLRRPGWRDEVRELTGGQGLSSFPPLWSAEARQDLSATSLRAVPLAELLRSGRDTAVQLDGTDPGFLGVT